MLLEVNSVTKTFGGLVAIRDLNIKVDEGETIGLIGPNGSGKTTAFNLISGFLKPDKGEIKVQDRDVSGLKPHKVCQSGIARTFQLTKPFSEMTALQNVMVGMLYGGDEIRSVKKAEGESEKVLEFVGLGARAHTMASTFGVVDRKKLEIARSLATNPKMLLLDEMMSGLTPTEMEDALKLLKTIRDSGVTLIIVEHVMKAILDISSRLIVLNYGEKIAEGPPQEVVCDKKVIEVYLGE